MIHRFLSTSSSAMALFALISCDENSPLTLTEESPVSPPSAAASGPRMVPWKESYEASGTITPDASCPAPLLLVSLAGGGTATHIGKYTITNSHCVNPETGALTGGSFVKTAANGDQIRGTYDGSSEPAAGGGFRVSGRVTFTGGTGRFARATGSADMAGSLQADFSQPTPPWPTQVTLTMVGKISY